MFKLCSLLNILSDSLEIKAAKNLLEEAVQHSLADENKRLKVYNLLAQSLKTVDCDMPLKELLCIYNALHTMFMLLNCLLGENDESNLLEEAINILTGLKNLINCQEE